MRVIPTAPFHLFRRSFHLKISDSVRQALAERKPIVALESTIISHGMPYPRNIEVAKKIEQTVRDNGAIPATIAVLNGVPHIGLDEQQLEVLANREGNVRKASTRDLAFVCAAKQHAATTVASTMKLASLAGIHVFGTGGLGGVHRGAELSMDISADLIELGKTPVTVVCAGIKSILDIKKSLEVLETQGVPVVGYQTKNFPAFFTTSSGCSAPMTANTPLEIAQMMQINSHLQITSGMVVAVPNPSPLDESFINDVISSALLEAERLKIDGAKITPYLLSRIEKMSEGRSLESNIALVLNNVKIAAEIAKCFSQLNSDPRNSDPRNLTGSTTMVDMKTTEKTAPSPISSSSNTFSVFSSTVNTSPSPSSSFSSVPTIVKREHNDTLVIGGAVVDIIGNVTAELTIANTSNPGVVHTSNGGVGRNIAEQLTKLGMTVALSSAVGADDHGKALYGSINKLNIDTSMVIQASNGGTSDNSDKKNYTTACYNAIHDKNGELIMGIADMNIFQLLNDSQYLESLTEKMKKSKIIIIDGNIPKESFQFLAQSCESLGKPLFFDPTSDHKCLLPFHANSYQQVGGSSLPFNFFFPVYFILGK
jgi:pseudouridine-5'-phosphate glycosidase